MAKSIEAGLAFLKLDIDEKEFNKKLAQSSRNFKNFGQSLTSIGVGVGALGAAITSPLALATVKASEAQEVFSKFEAVFGPQTEAVREWGDELAKQVGRSKVEIAGAAAGLQDLFVPLGLSNDEALDLSKSLTELSIDLGSFNNIADADVMRDLQAAMTGSSETMKKYGVVVDAAAVKQELLNMNMDPKTATNAQKVMARYNIIMDKTTAAQGDAARTADSFSNQTKAVKAAIEDAAAEIGVVFLPAAEKVASVVRDAIVVFAEWAKGNETLVLVIGAVGAGAVALGVALIALGKITTGLSVAMVVLSKGGVALAGIFKLLTAGATAQTIATGALAAAQWVLNTAAIGFGTILGVITAHPIIAALTAMAAAVLGLAYYFGFLGDESEEASAKLSDMQKKAEEFKEGAGLEPGDTEIEGLGESNAALAKAKQELEEFQAQQKEAERLRESEQAAQLEQLQQQTAALTVPAAQAAAIPSASAMNVGNSETFLEKIDRNTSDMLEILRQARNSDNGVLIVGGS